MKGHLIVLEGIDGSGKATQSEFLEQNLISLGKDVMHISFPDYESESSALVKMYLRGDFGTNPDQISPYISSTFFAADRYASYKTDFEDFYLNGGIILADRYTTSNMVHQASKIHDETERNQFLDWLWAFEFQLYRIPIPDQVFFLDVAPSTAIRLMENRENKFSHLKEKDIHEKSQSHLKESYENALWLVRKYQWESIDCNGSEGHIESIANINDMIYQRILKYIEV